LRRVARGEMRIHSHRHTHDGEEHAHLHLHAAGAERHAHHGIGHRPFVIGVVHGLAGSAALTLFVLGTIASPWAGLLYVALFGAGTVAGMLIMSSLISLPFNLASRRLQGFIHPLQLGVGLGSFAFGLFYTWRIVAAGLPPQ
jgi:ABC-type nickel/cobalt efflux system permease component RcnA